MEFEANVGDMASIIKVEKRRMAALEKVPLILLLIKTFKFTNKQPFLTLGRRHIRDGAAD